MNPQTNWCFTLNNFTSDDLEHIEDVSNNASVSYLLIGQETGESGTPHIQGFIQFNKKLRFNQVKDLISQRIHLEACKGTAFANIAYCKKEGNFQEWGTPKHRGESNFNFFLINRE